MLWVRSANCHSLLPQIDVEHSRGEQCLSLSVIMLFVSLPLNSASAPFSYFQYRWRLFFRSSSLLLLSLACCLPLSQYLSIKKPPLLNTANYNNRLKLEPFSSSWGDRWKVSGKGVCWWCILCFYSSLKLQTKANKWCCCNWMWCVGGTVLN